MMCNTRATRRWRCGQIFPKTHVRAHNRCRDNTLRLRTPARSTRCHPPSIALVRIAAAAAVVAVTRRRVVQQVHDVELEDVRVTPLPRTARTATSIIEWGQR
jgi:hypothetical protein